VIARANPSLPTLPSRAPRPRAAATKPVWLDLPSFTAFAQDVEDAMIGDELNYSDRLKLLKRANHFGIRRFDANLIIAMVQNRVQGRLANLNYKVCQEQGRSGTLAMWTLVAVVQSLIVAAGWWMLS
jgi:hypothetical protein